MKVAVIIPAVRHVGPVKVIETLVHSIKDFPGIRIEVFHLDRAKEDGINITVPLKHLDTKQFPFEDYDIVHTNGIRPDLFAFMNRKRIKYHISTIHNFVYKDLRYTYNLAISVVFGLAWILLWHRADKLVCVSASQKKYYSRWFNPDRLSVIHNGVPEIIDNDNTDDEFLDKIGAFRSRGLKIIGTASAVTRGKGLEQVLPLLSQNSGLAFVLIGKGKKLSYLKKEAQRLNIVERCYFPGFKKHAINYFRHFDLFIIPSRSEGFCLALVEAVSLKIPVLCTELDVFRELFSGDEVTFFKLDNLPDLVKASGEASLHGSSKAEMAFSHYKKAYTGRVMGSNYYELYISVTR